MLAANQTKVLRKRAKRQNSAIHQQTIDLACERFFRSRGMPLKEKFNNWESLHAPEAPDDQAREID